MLELAEMVVELTGLHRWGSSTRPLPSDDPKQRQPDITLAARHLDWEPTIALRAGLAKTIPYFADELARQT